jgi:glyoxylase-like metal-dependent hydrolase (beta-lactamase superfamily II)
VALDVRMLTVGPLQENCFLVRADADAATAVMVDPGEEPERLLAALRESGATLEAILLTHCHFDHIGAVAPVARATGAEVWCPELETDLLTDLMTYVPYAELGPYESHDPEHTVAGGETLQLAGMEIDVLSTPGHSPGHVTYAPRGADAIFSGDVLFQSSIGRTDLPGGHHPTLMASIAALLERFDDDTRVHPGHMGLTTLGAERRTNPFLADLVRG